MSINPRRLADDDSVKKIREVILLRVDELLSSASQVRKTFNGLDELGSSILQEGQIQPIVVSPKGDRGFYTIQKGERRWRACQQAGISHVEAIINDREQSELDEIAGELIENIQRENLSPMEISVALQSFVDAGWPQNKIARRLGKNSSYVSTHISLLRLPECVAEIYQRGVTRDTETLNNIRLLFELDSEKCKKVCQVALENGISRKLSREIFNEAKRGSMRSERRGMGFERPSAPPPSGGIGILSTLSEITPAKQSGSWRTVNPAEVLIAVNVLFDTNFQRGSLLLGRVDSEPDYVWVKCLTKGEEKIVRVHVTDIELLKIESRSY